MRVKNQIKSKPEEEKSWFVQKATSADCLPRNGGRVGGRGGDVGWGGGGVRKRINWLLMTVVHLCASC